MCSCLSVIIPTYNRSSYVRECLTAIDNSGVSNLEIIVADDGSTDDTRDVVAKTSPHAKYLWQRNSGTPATARNKGFQASQGEYVGFLDCDDAWLPNVSARAVNLLDRYPDVDVLFADARMGNPEQGYVSWIEGAGQAAFFALPSHEPEPGLRILEKQSFFRRLAVRNPVFIGACIMRREAFEQVGMFDPSLCGAADWELWLRMASQFTFAFLNKPMAVYTRHLDNMSSDYDKMGREFCQALANVLLKCDLSKENERFIRSRLQHHLFGHAYQAYDGGNVDEARTRFWKAIRAGHTHPKTWAYWLGCHLPEAMLKRLRNWKHTRQRATG